ncbi:Transmembrane domain-containing protein [Spironucleus salmonicida]|uniref:Transmembrane domain-containing protein n=1 Tax=Spironucleus salmonicida TaxID=348837 RepID=V6LXJ1_9EUKA|nr:Transmembrane domain-containing protein [Spironucleus salmonicida]|eukprot:EST48968.1 Transmembrane domain-containing protein [Spironucleus salmonicida]
MDKITKIALGLFLVTTSIAASVSIWYYTQNNFLVLLAIAVIFASADLLICCSILARSLKGRKMAIRNTVITDLMIERRSLLNNQVIIQ